MKAIHAAFKAALLVSTALAAPTAALAQDDQEQDQAAGQLPMEQVVVTGRYIPDEKRATSEISSLLDAEDFAITGDSSAATALRRVTGLSLVGDGFVYVRGLGERYSKALLNGAELPSPLPLQRVVPLDIFPASFLSSILVQKTYSPEFPSEFGGGVIEMRTASLPDEGFVTLGASVGVDFESTGKQGLAYKGGDLDILGFDDGFRDLPGLIVQTPLREIGTQLSPEQLESAAEELPNVWSIDGEPNAPNVGLDFSFGDRFEFGDGQALGILAVVSYKSDFSNRFGQRNTVTVGNEVNLNDRLSPEACELEEDAGDDCGFRSTQWDIFLNGILSVGLEINTDHTLKFDTLVLRKSTREGEIEKGFIPSEDAIRTRNRIDWVEQQTWINQLSGEHLFSFSDGDVFGETVVEWYSAYSESTREAPLRRETEYELGTLAGGGTAFLLDTDSAETSWSALDDMILDVGLDVTQQMTIGDIPVDLKLGVTYYYKEREAVSRSFRFLFPGGTSRDLLRLIPEQIFTPANIGPGGIRLIETSVVSDVFDGEIKNLQGYAGIDVQLFPTVRVAAGMRGEDSQIVVNNAFRSNPIVSPATFPDTVTFINPSGQSLQPGDPIRTTLDSETLLPAATLTWEFANNMQVRAAYSQTLARPSTRELSFAEFLNPQRGAPVFGNPTLIITEIDNYDFRWEWYFGAGEFVTVGFFYKDMANPIERSFVFDGDQVTRTYINGDDARLIGVEAEVEKHLPFYDWFDWEWIQTKDFFVKANGAYIDAETTISGRLAAIVTNTQRRLQGQSRILGNFQFGYEDFEKGERAAIVFNFTGKRIQDVGILGAPDIFETPPKLLGVTYAREFEIFGGIWEFSFEADNLLGDDFSLTQGGLIVENYAIGRTISFGVKAKY